MRQGRRNHRTWWRRACHRAGRRGSRPTGFPGRFRRAARSAGHPARGTPPKPYRHPKAAARRRRRPSSRSLAAETWPRGMRSTTCSPRARASRTESGVAVPAQTNRRRAAPQHRCCSRVTAWFEPMQNSTAPARTGGVIGAEGSAACPRQRRGQSSRTGPQHLAAAGQNLADDGIEIAIRSRVHRNIAAPAARASSSRPARRERTRRPAREIRWQMNRLEIRGRGDPQVAALHDAAHRRKRGRHHGGLAAECFGGRTDFLGGPPAQRGIDLLEQHADRQPANWRAASAAMRRNSAAGASRVSVLIARTSSPVRSSDQAQAGRRRPPAGREMNC